MTSSVLVETALALSNGYIWRVISNTYRLLSLTATHSTHSILLFEAPITWYFVYDIFKHSDATYYVIIQDVHIPALKVRRNASPTLFLWSVIMIDPKIWYNEPEGQLNVLLNDTLLLEWMTKQIVTCVQTGCSEECALPKGRWNYLRTPSEPDWLWE